MLFIRNGQSYSVNNLFDDQENRNTFSLPVEGDSIIKHRVVHPRRQLLSNSAISSHGTSFVSTIMK